MLVNKRPTTIKGLDYSALETRCLLASITLNDGLLKVVGNAGNDIVAITEINQLDHIPSLSVVFESEFDLRGLFPVNEITSIEFYGLSGNDSLTVSSTAFESRSSNLVNLKSVHFFGNEGGDNFFFNLSGLNDSVIVEGIGGAGNDTLSAFKWGFDFQTVPMVQVLNRIEFFGGDGNDRLTGGFGSDLLVGGQGNDYLLGHVGEDVLYGGFGTDELYGGSGNDMIYGGAGDDLLDGNFPIGDTYTAGIDPTDNDILMGGDGNDRILGRDGQDQVLGGRGADTLLGGDGNDTLLGGENDDVLNGGTGEDHVYGQDGNDHLIGSEGSDVLSGGNGNDKILGGSGNDRLNGSFGDDVLLGQNGDDRLVGQFGNDTMFGGSGNDVLFGLDGDDVLSGGEGDDILRGGEGTDQLYGYLGNDRLYGEQGADILIGDQGRDVLVGGTGVDLLKGGLGRDRLEGNAGRDSFFSSSEDWLVDFSWGLDSNSIDESLQDYLGLTLAGARELADRFDRPARVRSIDGQGQLGTADYLPERLNFAIENDLIVGVATDAGESAGL